MFNSIDYIIDSNEKGHPKMITGLALREGLKQLVKQPFRLVPYFDPGVWGGQWMKEHCNLDPHEKIMLGVLMVFLKKIVYIYVTMIPV